MVKMLSVVLIFLSLFPVSYGLSFKDLPITTQKMIWEVGNGGDSIFCKNPQGELEYNTLDFILEFHRNTNDLLHYNDNHTDYSKRGESFWSHFEHDWTDDTLSVFSAFIEEEALKPFPNQLEEKILSLLQRHTPKLARNYKNFLFLKLNPYRAKEIVWQEISDLPQIRDEQVLDLPPECNPISQVVVRHKTESQLIFYYDLGEMVLIQFNPVQESFLFLHEWLWSHLDNSEKIRKANWFLHSKYAYEMNEKEFINKLSDLGFVDL